MTSEEDHYHGPRRVDTRDWCVGVVEGRKIQLGRVKKDGTPGYVTKRWKAEDHAFPQGLLNTFNKPMQAAVDKIPKRERYWKAVREAVLIGLTKGARLAHCTAKIRGTRHLTVSNYREDPAIDFLVLDRQSLNCSQFYHKRKDGQPFLNRWGHPQRSIRRLAEHLHHDSHSVRKLERERKAPFRVAVVVFRGGVVWLVPLRVSHESESPRKHRHHRHKHKHRKHAGTSWTI
jgi:hypothetical protein